MDIFINFVQPETACLWRQHYELSDMGINEIWSEFKETGTTKSFRKLYDAVFDVLSRYASYYLNSLDAEEVVLDLMLYLWTHRKSLEVHTSFEAYLRTSIHNRCLNKLRNCVPSTSLELVANIGQEIDMQNLAA
ncbi:MAG: sigma factor, partial [Candidatus Cryptobacteroides sp.]